MAKSQARLQIVAQAPTDEALLTQLFACEAELQSALRANARLIAEVRDRYRPPCGGTLLMKPGIEALRRQFGPTAGPQA